MEASVAAGGEAAQADGQGQEAQGPSIDGVQLTQQLEALAGGQEEMRQFLQSQPWAQAEQQQAEEQGIDDFDISGLLDLDSPSFDPQQVATGITELVQQAATQQTQAALQPLAAKLEQMETQRAEDIHKAETYALVEEFPELGKREVALEVVQTARDYAEQNFPPEIAEKLAKSAAWTRAIYMAGRAADAANAEDENVQTAVLEGGHGARPGIDPSQLDQLGDSIVGPRGGSGVLPFG